MRQLSQLRALLAQSDCHYIRCVKPNNGSVASVWDPAYVCRQLAQAINVAMHCSCLVFASCSCRKGSREVVRWMSGRIAAYHGEPFEL